MSSVATKVACWWHRIMSYGISYRSKAPFFILSLLMALNREDSWRIGGVSCPNWGSGFSWHLMGRSQGCFWQSHRLRTTLPPLPPSKISIKPSVRLCREFLATSLTLYPLTLLLIQGRNIKKNFFFVTAASHDLPHSNLTRRQCPKSLWAKTGWEIPLPLCHSVITKPGN